MVVKASGHLNNDNKWSAVAVANLALVAGETAPGRVAVPGLTGHEVWGFDGGGATEVLLGTVELPPSYAQGSAIRPYLTWGGANSNSGNVKWQLAYAVALPGKEFGQEVIIAVTAANPGLGTNSRPVVRVSEFGSIAGAGLLVGSTLSLRLLRNSGDAVDTYASDALVFGLGLHIEVDGSGSDQVLIK